MGKGSQYRTDQRIMRKVGKPHRRHERIWAKITDKRVDAAIEVAAVQKQWPDWFRWARYPRK